jgi:hypothetical protein
LAKFAQFMRTVCIPLDLGNAAANVGTIKAFLHLRAPKYGGAFTGNAIVTALWYFVCLVPTKTIKRSR